MTTYRIKLVSQTNAIVLIFTLLIAFFVEAATFFPHGLHNETLSILLTLLEFAVAIFLWQKFVTGWTEWKVNDDRIIISWIKRFAFSTTNDYIFEWKDIEKIMKGMDPNYYNLKFRFESGQTVTFYHASFASDNFKELITILYQTFDEKKKLKTT